MITETLSLTRFNLRLRRRFLLLWIVPLLALIGALPSGYDTQYPDPASRKLAADAFRGNAIVEAMYGQAPGDGSLGQLVTLEGGALLTLLAGVMTVLLVTGLFRGPEQAGTGDQFPVEHQPSEKWREEALNGVLREPEIAQEFSGGNRGAIQPCMRFT